MSCEGFPLAYNLMAVGGCAQIFEVFRYSVIRYRQGHGRLDLDCLAASMLFGGIILAIALSLQAVYSAPYLYFNGLYFFLTNIGICYFVLKKLRLTLLQFKKLPGTENISRTIMILLGGLVCADFGLRMKLASYPLADPASFPWYAYSNTTCAVIKLLISIASASFAVSLASMTNRNATVHGNIYATQMARLVTQFILAVVIMALSQLPGQISYMIMAATHFITWLDFAIIVDEITLVVPMTSVLNSMATGESNGNKATDGKKQKSGQMLSKNEGNMVLSKQASNLSRDVISAV